MVASTKSVTYTQFRYFVALARNLSYRRAAQFLGISQPTLTAQINVLEKHLGISLFERSRSGTFLSPEGRSLLPYAEEVIKASVRFEEKARDIAGGNQTTYRLGVPPTLGPYLLPYILPQLHKRYSKLKFYVREAAPTKLVQELFEGQFDLIISPTLQESSQLISTKLCVEPLKFVVPSDHPLSGLRYIEPEQIHGETVLTLEEAHHFHHQVHEICLEIGAQVTRDYEGTSLDTLRQMVVMGMGVAFLPGLYVHSELHQPDELHVCELKDKPIERQHNLIWRNTAPGRVFFRELGNEIRRILSETLAHAVRVDE